MCLSKFSKWLFHNVIWLVLHIMQLFLCCSSIHWVIWARLIDNMKLKWRQTLFLYFIIHIHFRSFFCLFNIIYWLKNGKLEVIDYLLGVGANIEARSEGGNTALHSASFVSLLKFTGNVEECCKVRRTKRYQWRDNNKGNISEQDTQRKQVSLPYSQWVRWGG